MKLKIHAPMLVAIVAGVLIQTSGCCTLVGYGIGSMVDAGKVKKPLPQERWGSISQGTDMDVRLREGPPFRTRFLVFYGDQMQIEPGPPWLPRADRQSDTSGPVWIPLDEVAAIEVQRSAAKTGLAIGLCVDFIIGLAAMADYSPEWDFTDRSRD